MKAREFWIDPSDADDDYAGGALYEHPGQGPIKWQADLIHVREVLPGEKTPEQVIQAVCEFLAKLDLDQFDVGIPLGAGFAGLIQANKERILK